MSQINKIDYFVGVFLTEILSSTKTIPALFDGEQNDSKRIEFEINKGVQNIYIKYSTKKKATTYYENGKKRKKYVCNVSFTENEYEKIQEFSENGKWNFVIIVWTNETLTNTWFVVLDYDTAMQCLKSKTDTGRRIKIVRFGAGREFYCYGVDFKDDEYLKCSFDHIKYFEMPSI